MDVQPTQPMNDALWQQAIRETFDSFWYVKYFSCHILCSDLLIRHDSSIDYWVRWFTKTCGGARQAGGLTPGKTLREYLFTCSFCWYLNVRQGLQGRLSAPSQTHLLSNIRRLTWALQTHTLIKHRLLRLTEHIHLLIPSLRSAEISPEEEALRAKL